MYKDDCLFCKIIAGAIPAEKIYEDEHTFAFLDIHPINRGHALVIPKQHAENIMTIRKEDFTAVMETVRMLSPVIQRAVGAEGVNIGINNGSAAGQIIFHAHVHVMPRFENDGHTHWEAKTLTSEEIAATGLAIRNELA
jgi:histidine triad (HIT) family protein